MATTLQTANRGNLAIETHVWRLSLDDAKTLIAWMKSEKIPMHKGGTWDSFVASPIRCAIRRKLEVAKIYTGGFMTGELSNFFFNAGIKIEMLPDV